MMKSLCIAVVVAATLLFGSSLLRAEPIVSRASFEYKSLFLNDVKSEDAFSKILNDLAADRWEYDGSLGIVAIFRRNR